MATTFRTILAVFLITALAGCGSTPTLHGDDPGLADLAWLTGAWVGQDNDGTITEEHWTQPSAGAMFGISRTIADDRTVFFEFLRIEHTSEDEVVYFASPEGRPPTSFGLIEQSGTRFVFENAEHDFPQRIIYEPQPDGSLLMRIEGVENGQEKSSQWRLRRARLLSGLTEYERRQRELDRYWRRQQLYDGSLFIQRID